MLGDNRFVARWSLQGKTRGFVDKYPLFNRSNIYTYLKHVIELICSYNFINGNNNNRNNDENVTTIVVIMAIIGIIISFGIGNLEKIGNEPSTVRLRSTNRSRCP